MFDVDDWSRTTTTQQQGNTKYDWEGKQSGKSFHVLGLGLQSYKRELLIRSAIKKEGWTEYNFPGFPLPIQLTAIVTTTVTGAIC